MIVLNTCIKIIEQSSHSNGV